MKHLSASAQETFDRWIERSNQMVTHTESILRAAIEKDAAAYHASLEKLHPGRGEKGKMLSTVYLSKIAKRVYDCKQPDFENLPQENRADDSIASDYAPMGAASCRSIFFRGSANLVGPVQTS